MSERFTGTQFANPFNSTDFTDCCGLAVLRTDERCPGCGAKVTSRASSNSALRARLSRVCLMCGEPRNKCYC